MENYGPLPYNWFLGPAFFLLNIIEKPGITSPVYRCVWLQKKLWMQKNNSSFVHENQPPGKSISIQRYVGLSPFPVIVLVVKWKWYHLQNQWCNVACGHYYLEGGPTLTYVHNNLYIFLLGRCYMASWKNDEFKRQKQKCGRIHWEHFLILPALKLDKFLHGIRILQRSIFRFHPWILNRRGAWLSAQGGVAIVFVWWEPVLREQLSDQIASQLVELQLASQ